MRVVLDTNVFISSFLGKGPPRKIIDLWKKGQVTLCFSREIVDEYLSVTHRLGLKDEKEVSELLNLFAKGFHSVFTTDTPTLHVVLEDPHDNKFFECAVALKASHIISRDKAVLNVKNYMGVQVVPPRDFVKSPFPSIEV